MNRKGFTLIEIIAVIVILGILGVIVLPIVTGVIAENDKKIDEYQEKLIVDAAKGYFMKNAFNDVKCVDVSRLEDEGLLDNLNVESQGDNIDYNKYKVEIEKDEENSNRFIYKLSKGNCPDL